MSLSTESLNNGRPSRPYLPGCGPLNLSSNRGRHTREYLDAHKNVEKRRRDRINNCLETIRQFVPACRKVPLSRRLEKGEILDMTISYLQLVNHFLAGIGVHDVYSASKEEVRLYMGIDNWIREHQNDYTTVSEFTKDIRSLLQNEMEVISTQITMEHSWLSRKSSTFGELYMEDSVDDGFSPTSAHQANYEDDKPLIVPSTNCQERSPPLTASSARIKQEYCPTESPAEPPATAEPSPIAEPPAKKLKEAVTDECEHVHDSSPESLRIESQYEGSSIQSSTRIAANSSASTLPSSESCHCSTGNHQQSTSNVSNVAPPSSPESYKCAAGSHQERTSSVGKVAPTHHSALPCSSVGDVKVSTSMGCITIPIRLGSIQIEAPKEMLQPLQQVCTQPIVFNAQIESSGCAGVGERCQCKRQQKPQGLSIQVTEAKEKDYCTKNNQDNVQSRYNETTENK